VRITQRSSPRDVALAVGRTLAENGIRAVLTGGGCASLHSAGHYLSADLDFVLTGSTTRSDLDRAMASVGFTPQGDRYVHPRSDFWVEFPRGPLAVGADLDVALVEIDEPAGRVVALSPTDSCRDRLAAFYHWSDRQSLEVAVAVAARNEIDLDRIRRWSDREGHAARFEEFRRELARAQ
jgi:hypothetical protein